MAIADITEMFRECGHYQELGMNGDYFVEFFPEWENLDDKIGWYWEYILLSDTELVIPEARSGMYKMEKVEEYIEPNNEIDSLSVCKYYGLHYGTWEITKQLGNPCQYVSIGDRLEIRKKRNLLIFAEY